jgi:hypothetical protein
MAQFKHLNKLTQSHKMRATYKDHQLALVTCEKICKALPNLSGALTIGTPEQQADEQLVALSEICLSYTANQSCPASIYYKAVSAIDQWQAVLSGSKLPAAVFEIESEDQTAAICTTSSGKRYGLAEHAQGWVRGGHFGATIADAMRGAE